MSGLWLAGAAAAQEITAARYEGPTTRYPHGVLGDEIEHTGLAVTLSDGRVLRASWERDVVFEDTEPRLADLDGDGAPEVIVVESHETQGARLAIWGMVSGNLAQITATPFIGTRFRWLAPVGAADLDGDGVMELAYVDRPHLAKTLRVWRYETQGRTVRLREVASLKGVTNHRIGEVDIAGGIRDCGQGPEMIVADAGWREVLALRFDGAKISQQSLGAHRGRDSFARAMRCETLQ
ncbi:VCBS repeat-containing protein [Primorskyibacter aestuariivivens]|nr:VCBS repeat-containing protein [Primorskyibacter aestuariivivens]MDA7427064.1 VCBS repeat-containing protein [Primorskyibacter aestuariivivens]